jgi:predicted RNA-binding Zn ribbon-like protein
MYDAAVLVRDLDAATLLAVRLTNSYDVYEAEPEALQRPEDLRALLRANGISVANPTTRDLTEAQALREPLRQLFEARAARTKARVLNDLLSRASARPTVVTDPSGWAVTHEVDADARLARRLAVICGLGLADALERYGDDRLKVCDAAPCERVFIDLSKNLVRRHCSRRCANRTSAAAFRARRARAAPSIA